MTRTGLLGVLLLGFALQAQALTLGRIRGAAIIGQPLSLIVPVTPDANETVTNLCAEVELFHADARQDPARIQISVEPAAAGQPANLLISSGAVVDEPMVTIYLRAGCAQRISRRYVLLADIASEPQSAAITARIAQAAATLPTITAPAAGAAPTIAAPVAAATSTSSAPPSGTGAQSTPTQPAAGAGDSSAPAAAAPRAKRPVQERAAARKPPSPPKPVAKPQPTPPKAATTKPAAAPIVAEKLQAGRSAGQSRLRLDPVELLAERVATLESAAASAPAASVGMPAEDAQRIRALEDSVKTLVALASKNENNLLDMRKRLERAESERYANPVVYGLALALLLCLAAIAYLLTRRGAGKSAERWWGEAEGAGAPGLAPRPPEPPPMPAEVPMPSAPISLPDSLGAPLEVEKKPVARNTRPAPVTQVDVSLVEMSESTFDRLMQTGATHSAVRKVKQQTAPAPVEPVAPSAQRQINSEELFDIRQQAEFFVSLGQTDQAVRILENRISESGETSPAAYLDLLKIFHSLGLKADFRQVREDFNLLFNAKVPDFAGFAEEGRALEEYSQVMDEIALAWARGNAVETLEGLAFREQWNRSREVFDLAAFRDLLLLHAVAQSASGLNGEMVKAAQVAKPRLPPSSQFGMTLPGSNSLVVPAVPSSAAAADADAPLPSLELAQDGVDIDLSDPADDTSPPDSVAANLIDFDVAASAPKPLDKA